MRGVAILVLHQARKASHMMYRSYSYGRQVKRNSKPKNIFSSYPPSFKLAGLIIVGISLVIVLAWMFTQNANAHGYAENGLTSTEGNSLNAASDTPISADSNADSKKDDWMLILVNADNPVPRNYKIDLVPIGGNHEVDQRIAHLLQQMLDDCISEGLLPTICSAYRTYEYQENLTEQNVESLLYQGYSEKDARAETAKSIALPGTSEHHLGLAVDIVDYYDQNLDTSQENTEVQKWLMENSWKYGFTLRYPSDKSDITGIIYEPWHYRYVGVDAAKEMYETGLCLEEYLTQ